jgi:coproporphyrinogen III oxidase-like Fe-S oxidoreductase
VSGRLHTRAMVEKDLGRLRSAGIDNLSVDLIAGLAGQTFASWMESLEVLADCGVAHASVYMLEVDEDSRLGRELLAGGARYYAGLVPTGDAIAQMYEQAAARLEAAGLKQYEISNFCRPGCESRHNLRYWRRRPYLGVGLDASSMLAYGGPVDSYRGLHGPGPGYVLRATTTDDLKAYLEGAELAETEWLSPSRQHEEAWFLGLRLNTGVSVAGVEREFGGAAAALAVELVERLAADGLVTFDGDTVRLTARGRLLSNEVFQEFLDLEVNEETGYSASPLRMESPAMSKAALS